MKQIKKEIIFRILVISFITWGILSNSFFLLLISGIILGLYYGYYNDIIWDPEGDIKPLRQNPFYRGHQIWVHLICGIIASCALYLFLQQTQNLHLTTKDLNWQNFILFIILTLGYSGLLARSLWFLSNRGKL